MAKEIIIPIDKAWYGGTKMKDSHLSKIGHSAFIALAISVFVPSLAKAQVNSQTLHFDYPAEQVVVIGQGWNTESGRATASRCVDGSVYAVPGSATSIELKSVQTAFELAQSLEFGSTTKLNGIVGKGSSQDLFKQSASINGAFANVAGIVIINTRMGLGPKKIGPDSGDADLINQAPGSIVVGSTAWSRMRSNQPQDIDEGSGADISLLPDKRALAKSDPEKFRKQCGDTYVSLVVLGGRLSALISFFSVDLGLQLEISNKLSGNVAVGGSIDENMSASMKAAFKQGRVTYRLNFLGPTPTGGSCDLSDSSKFSSCLMATMQSFVEAASPKKGQTLSPIAVTVSRYEALANWPGGDLDVRQAGPMDRIASLYSDFLELYQTTGWLTKSDFSWNPKSKQCDQTKDTSGDSNRCFLWHRGTSPQDVRKLQDEVHDVVLRLQKVAAECLEDPDACEVPDDIGVGKQYDPYAIRAHFPMPYSAQHQPYQTPTEAAIEGAVRKYWISRISERRCSFQIDSDQCLKNAQIDGYAIPATARPNAPLPKGSYSRSCRECQTSWSAGDTPILHCSCGTGKKKQRRSSSISWVNCPKPQRIANCRGKLTCPDKC